MTEVAKIKPGHHVRRKASARRAAHAARDLDALVLYSQGKKLTEVSKILGYADETGAWYAVQRGLKRRIEQTKEQIEVARARYLERLERLVEAWMPLATGTLTLDDDGEPPARPDPRAADVVLKVLAQIAEIEHTTVRPAQPVTGTTVTVNNHVYSDQTTGSELQSRILASLDQMRQKMRVVDGTFAQVGTTLAGAAGEPDDRDAPPPFLALPSAPEDAA